MVLDLVNEKGDKTLNSVLVLSSVVAQKEIINELGDFAVVKNVSEFKIRPVCSCADMNWAL